MILFEFNMYKSRDPFWIITFLNHLIHFTMDTNFELKKLTKYQFLYYFVNLTMPILNNKFVSKQFPLNVYGEL